MGPEKPKQDTNRIGWTPREGTAKNNKARRRPRCPKRRDRQTTMLAGLLEDVPG